LLDIILTIGGAFLPLLPFTKVFPAAVLPCFP